MTPLWPLVAQACIQQARRVALSRVVNTHAEVNAAAAEIGLPLVARPLSPPGEYCAMLAEYTADTELAFARARAQSSDSAVVFQRRYEGPLYAVCATHGDDGWEALGPVEVVLLDKYALTPMEYTFPANLAPDIALELREIAVAALRRTPNAPLAAVCEFVLTSEGPLILFARGIALPDPPMVSVMDLVALHGAACQCFLCPNTGLVEFVEGVDIARVLPGVKAIEIRVQPGDPLRHATSIAARDSAGYVLAVGATPAEAQERARAAAALVSIVTTPFA